MNQTTFIRLPSDVGAGVTGRGAFDVRRGYHLYTLYGKCATMLVHMIYIDRCSSLQATSFLLFFTLATATSRRLSALLRLFRGVAVDVCPENSNAIDNEKALMALSGVDGLSQSTVGQ
ncbi:hypothetical protein FRC12_018803 [Ceratobasidium sp. 428]|nr:hypothetical protein FRC12_018803 [Ceratobasidium sp. 428]